MRCQFEQLYYKILSTYFFKCRCSCAITSGLGTFNYLSLVMSSTRSTGEKVIGGRRMNLPQKALVLFLILVTQENIKNLRLHRLYIIVSNGTASCPVTVILHLNF